MPLDPAMTNAQVPNVFCNMRIMVDYAVDRNAPQMITCMGNMPIAYAQSIVAEPPLADAAASAEPQRRAPR